MYEEYLEKNSQESSISRKIRRRKGTARVLLPALCCEGRLLGLTEGVAVGALYNYGLTNGGREGNEVRNVSLMEFVADGDCFVDSGGEKGFVVLVLVLLKGYFSVFGLESLIRFLPRVTCSHLNSLNQIIIFMFHDSTLKCLFSKLPLHF